MSDTKTKAVGGETSPIPVLDYFLADANVLIEGNRIVWARRDTGYAQNSTYALANPQNAVCLGRCIEHLDNTTPLGGAAVNAFNNPGTSGVRGRYDRGIFLCNGDGTITQASLGQPVFLVSDVTGTNNGVVTVGLSPLAGARPLVGFVTTNPRGSTDNPDASKIPVAIGLTPYLAGIPATLSPEYIDDNVTIHSAAFTVVPGVMHTFNFQATANINFPAVSQLLDGMKLAIINQGTGATASTLVAGGTSNMGVAGAGTTGATAAGPKSLSVQNYVANNFLGAWIPSL